MRRAAPRSIPVAVMDRPVRVLPTSATSASVTMIAKAKASNRPYGTRMSPMPRLFEA